jgi:hypothetical protein
MFVNEKSELFILIAFSGFTLTDRIQGEPLSSATPVPRLSCPISLIIIILYSSIPLFALSSSIRLSDFYFTRFMWDDPGLREAILLVSTQKMGLRRRSLLPQSDKALAQRGVSGKWRP